jgi:hypothetical protein
MISNSEIKPKARNFEVKPEAGAFALELTARREAARAVLIEELAAEAGEDAARVKVQERNDLLRAAIIGV